MAGRRVVQGLALVGVACAVAALAVAGFSSGPQPRSALLSRAGRQHQARRSQGAVMQQLEGPNAKFGAYASEVKNTDRARISSTRVPCAPSSSSRTAPSASR
ncbi:hypothetical protein T484DRAFT_2911367 [Baffinella frigidus]|nr:hypothetical protein T484DRAFT_2911367 [Cryptophyta sp. CCMP2293]